MKKLLLFFIVIGLAIGYPAFFSAAGEEDHDAYLWNRVDDTDDAITYSGLWTGTPQEDSYGGSEHLTFRGTAYAEFTFEGIGVRWLGSKDMSRGQADVYLNGELVAEGVDTYHGERVPRQVLFEKTGLEPGLHTIRIDPTGEKSPESILAHISIEAFAYIPSCTKEAEDFLARAQKEAPGFYSDEAVTAFREAIAHAEEVFKKDSSFEAMRDAVIDLHRAREEFVESTQEAVDRGIRDFVDGEMEIEGTILWLDAGTLAHEDNDPVANWDDQSGQDHHAFQGEGEFQPVYRKEGIKGHPAVEFDGGNDHLKTAMYPRQLLGERGSFTILFVAAPSTPNANLIVTGIGNWGISPTERWFVGHTGSNWYWGYGDHFDSGTHTPAERDVPAVVEWSYDAEENEVRLYLDGHRTYALDYGDRTGTIPDFALLVGALQRENGRINNYFQGHLAELMIFSRSLSELERRVVVGYLADKYDLER